MTYRIRELREADIESLQAIDADAHSQAWPRQIFMDQIEISSRSHLVALLGDEIVAHGALWFDGEVARITNVAVARTHRGRGLGRMVVHRLCQHAIEHQQTTMLSLEVAAANLAAQRLYRSMGFMPVGIDRAFYGPGKDALVMTVSDSRDPAWVSRLNESSFVSAEEVTGAVA